MIFLLDNNHDYPEDAWSFLQRGRNYSQQYQHPFHTLFVAEDSDDDDDVHDHFHSFFPSSSLMRAKIHRQQQQQRQRPQVVHLPRRQVQYQHASKYAPWWQELALQQYPMEEHETDDSSNDENVPAQPCDDKKRKRKSDDAVTIHIQHMAKRHQQQEQQHPLARNPFPMRRMEKTDINEAVQDSVFAFFNSIHNVPADGNCGYYVLFDFLRENSLLPISCRTVTDLRRFIYDFAMEHKDELLKDGSYFIENGYWRVFKDPSGERSEQVFHQDMSKVYNKDEHFEQIVGTFLFYARAVDCTMLTALNAISAQQAKATQKTATLINHFLDYCATHPNASTRYHASDMILHIHSDASYLCEPKARSRAAGHFFLGTHNNVLNNGAVLTLIAILRNVVSSAAEAEIGALFHNTKEGVALRIALDEMGHPQPATRVFTDNSTAAGIANDTVKQKRSKAIDMRYYWVRDRVQQGQYIVEWAPGVANMSDYHTKHHPAAHHHHVRPYYLHSEQRPMVTKLPQNLHNINALHQPALQGCVGSSIAQSWHDQVQSCFQSCLDRQAAAGKANRQPARQTDKQGRLSSSS